MKLIDTVTKKRYAVADWLTVEKNIRVRTMVVKDQTPKAFFMVFSDGQTCWLPKSHCKEIKTIECLDCFL